MTVEILNANTKEYWEAVKHRAAIRKGVAAFKLKYSKMRASMIYEQHVRNVLDLTKMAGDFEGLIDHPDRYIEYAHVCAKISQLPEIVIHSEEEISAWCIEAVAEAREAAEGS